MHTRPCLISTQRRRYSDASSAPRPSGSHTLPSGVPPKIGSLMPPTRSSTTMVGLGPMRVGRSTGAPEKDRGAAERDSIVCGARAQRGGWRRVPLDLRGALGEQQRAQRPGAWPSGRARGRAAQLARFGQQRVGAAAPCTLASSSAAAPHAAAVPAARRRCAVWSVSLGEGRARGAVRQ